MKSYAFCPVSDKKVNSFTIRLNAGLTSVLLILFLLSNFIIPVILLTIDFMLRAFNGGRFSLLNIISNFITRKFKLSGQFVNAGPKIFAARVGILLSIAILILSIFQFQLLAIAIALIFLVFALLESIAGVCVACKIYPFIYHWLYKSGYLVIK
jgi:hypothetical protein